MKALLLFSLIFFVTIEIRGATLLVTNTADSGPGSLRQAILDANVLGEGTITFSGITGTIQVLSGLPVLTGNISIIGPGASKLTVNYEKWPTILLTNSVTGTLMLRGLTFGGSRGSIRNDGTLTFVDCVAKGRSWTSAMSNYGFALLTNSTVAENFCNTYGAIRNFGEMKLLSCRVTDNRCSGSGSGIYNAGNLSVDACILVRNRYDGDGSGGGIYNISNAIVRNCAISQNSAGSVGGGVYNSASAFLAVTNCTINGNRATYSNPPCPGGGICNAGQAILENTTVSGNSGDGTGGGLYNSGLLIISSCTITENVATKPWEGDCAVGGGGLRNGGIVKCRNSIFAGNVDAGGYGPDVYGALESQGFNLVQNLKGCIINGDGKGDLYGLNPMLGPLQDNGGPTATHALLFGSPAVDGGSTTDMPSTDQRGVLRPQGPCADIGAHEYQYSVPVLSCPKPLDPAHLSLRVLGLPNTIYLLESSPDLMNWQHTVINTDVHGICENIILAVNNSPKCFYRVAAGP